MVKKIKYESFVEVWKKHGEDKYNVSLVTVSRSYGLYHGLTKRDAVAKARQAAKARSVHTIRVEPTHAANSRTIKV